MADCYELIDPKPTALEAPYTFFMPNPEQLATLAEGDFVKLVISATPSSVKCGSERVWVIVTAVKPDWLQGKLDNDPFDIPGLVAGALIRNISQLGQF